MTVFRQSSSAITCEGCGATVPTRDERAVARWKHAHVCDWDWRARAACRGTQCPDLFHPDGWGRGHARQIALAKTVCARCPVKAECLADALTTGDTDGIYGGTTPAERRNLKAPK